MTILFISYNMIYACYRYNILMPSFNACYNMGKKFKFPCLTHQLPQVPVPLVHFTLDKRIRKPRVCRDPSLTLNVSSSKKKKGQKRGEHDLSIMTLFILEKNGSKVCHRYISQEWGWVENRGRTVLTTWHSFWGFSRPFDGVTRFTKSDFQQ